MRALLVEDDPMIGDVVQAALKDEAYAVDWVNDGITAINTLRTQPYDVVLLDLGLPGKDGLQVLGALRSSGNAMPVVIMTARDALEDRIQGLDAGADDYLLKPFEMRELLARMRAVMRRKGGSSLPVLRNNVVSLDPASHEVLLLSTQQTWRLSNREFSLLQALLIRPGAILSRSELEEKMYGWGEEVESNAVEYFIHGLRKKLGSDVIKNVRGVGWMVSKGD